MTLWIVVAASAVYRDLVHRAIGLSSDGALLRAVVQLVLQVQCALLEVTAPLVVALGVLRIVVAAPPPLELMHRVGAAMWRR